MLWEAEAELEAPGGRGLFRASRCAQRPVAASDQHLPRALHLCLPFGLVLLVVVFLFLLLIGAAIIAIPGLLGLITSTIALLVEFVVTLLAILFNIFLECR